MYVDPVITYLIHLLTRMNGCSKNADPAVTYLIHLLTRMYGCGKYVDPVVTYLIYHLLTRMCDVASMQTLWSLTLFI